MSLHRNVGQVPLDGMPGGRQLFVGDDMDLTDDDLSSEWVALHIEQKTLAPVTMAKTAAPVGKNL